MSRAHERQPCACTACPCPNTAHAGLCYLCAGGTHRSSREVQRHLAEGLVESVRVSPTTLGSSGLSDRQLAQAREAWVAWHQRRACPAGWRP